MYKFLPLFVLTILFSLNSYSQLANDNCSFPQVISIPSSGSVCINSTNAGATSDLSTSSCDTGTPGNEVWYSYIAEGGQNVVTITPNGATPATNVVVQLQNTPCGSLTFNTCAVGAGTGAATAVFSYPIGTQIIFSVETNGTDGTFQVCVSSTTQPAAPGNSCPTATPICNKNPFSLSPFPTNSNVIIPSCFPTPFQQPIFYKFTVGVSGTCIWAATPTSTVEYDWVMYDITSGCPGTEVCCNFNYAADDDIAPIGMSATAPNNCGTSGAAGNAAEFSPPANVVAGRTYLIVIDNYSVSNVGFNFTWGGTFEMAPVAQFTVSPSSGCAPLNVSITNTSIASVSYEWNFGNGNTSTAVNPPAQTYSTDGNFLISLVATSASGCENATSQTISVNPLPTATISGTTTICSGTTSVITFNGTPNATVTYNINGGANQTIVLNTSGTGSVTSPVLTSTATYNLVSVSISGCSQSLSGSAVISIAPLPTATISGTTTICSGSNTTITFTGTPNATVSYRINGGAIQTIVLDASGNATLNTGALAANTTYSLVSVVSSGPPSCTRTITGNAVVTISPNPTATISGTSTICEGSSSTISFTGTANATITYTINGGANQTIVLNGAGTASFSTGALTTSTTYALVNVTGPAPASCSQAVSGTAVVTVNPIPVITPINDQISCNNSSVPSTTVTVTPSGTSTWSNSNTSIGLGASGSGNVPSFTATNSTGSPITATITINSTVNGCVATPETYTITIAQNPTVNAIASITQCANTSVSSVNFTSNPAGATFNWTNSNTTIGLSASGSGSTPAFTSSNSGSTPISGTITVTPSFGSCVGTPSSFTITVNPIPTVTASNNGPVCSGTPLNLSATGSAGSTYSWSGPNSFSSTNQNPVIGSSTTSNSGAYTVTITLNSCTSTSSTNALVNPLVTATITPAGPFCEDESPVNLTASITPGSWSGSGITNTATGQFSPSSASIGSNTITYTPLANCPVPSTTSIIVNPLPTVNFSALTTLGCDPFTTTFFDQTTPSSASVVWDFGDGTTSTQTPAVTHTFNTVGLYDITLTSTSNVGCTASKTLQSYISVIPQAVASFGVDNSEQTVLNPEFHFFNNSSNATTYQWEFGDGTQGTETNPIHLYDADPTSYTVVLIANNPGNCPDTASMTIVVKDELVFFAPNSFTPDGDEFNNDFQPVFLSGFDPQDFTMLIYNRWGEIIFESHDVDQGWDGTYHDELLKEGVYTWVFEFKSSENDKRFRFNGHVNLLK